MEQSTWLNLPLVLGDVSGYLGLLIGASVITLCEILDLVFYNVVVKLQRKFVRNKTYHNEEKDKHPNENNGSANV